MTPGWARQHAQWPAVCSTLAANSSLVRHTFLGRSIWAWTVNVHAKSGCTKCHCSVRELPCSYWFLLWWSPRRNQVSNAIMYVYVCSVSSAWFNAWVLDLSESSSWFEHVISRPKNTSWTSAFTIWILTKRHSSIYRLQECWLSYHSLLHKLIIQDLLSLHHNLILACSAGPGWLLQVYPSRVAWTGRPCRSCLTWSNINQWAPALFKQSWSNLSWSKGSHFNSSCLAACDLLPYHSFTIEFDLP